VLVDVDFELQAGEVHALVGANGAGKSTLARILSGLVRADAGSVTIDGRPHAPATRRAAEAAGVVIVLQELNILPTLSVAENLLLDRLPHRAGWLDTRAMHTRAATALARVGLGALDPTTPAGSLGVGEQQLIEIAAALDRRCRVLILDEPTAALTAPEIDRLFAHLRTLQQGGVGIIYISHRMDEIRRLGGRVSVLRDGRRVATRPSAQTEPAQLLRDMSGLEADRTPVRRSAAPGPVALRVVDLHAGTRVRGVSLEVRRGEVLGIAGLVGSGRTELLRAIYGADPVDTGEVYLGGSTEHAAIRGPHDAVALGLGLIPEDRKTDGLLLPLGIADNAGLATLAQDTRGGLWLAPASTAQRVAPACDRLGVVRASLEQPAGELSGGNQQKVVLARWLLRECAVLLVDEPTRGIDVPAKLRVHALLRELAARGAAVLVVSSETTELFDLCDRLLVMSAGRIAAELDPADWTEAAVLRAAFSGHLADVSSPPASR
jgi:ribose transport system ATP-binding protein